MTESGDPEAYTVVGVVRDVRWWSLEEEAASVYGPYGALAPSPETTFLIQTEGSQDRALGDALKAIEQSHPQMNALRAGALSDLFADTVRERQLRAWLFGSFAIGALVTVGTGVLGLLTMSTARRTRETGVRIALGATPASVVRLLVSEQLRPVIAGLVVGGFGAALAAASFRSSLYEVTPHDLRVWVPAFALVCISAAVGVLVPAMRASAHDPTWALREE